MTFVACEKKGDAVKVTARYPGIRCTKLQILSDGRPEHEYLWIIVHGSQDVLIGHGFITQAMLEQLPPCGKARFPKGGIDRPVDWQDSDEIKRGYLARTKKGFSFEKYMSGRDNVTALLMKVSIDDWSPPGEPSERWLGTLAEPAAAAATRSLNDNSGSTRDRFVGRYQRHAVWNCIEKLIIIDWAMIRDEAEVAHG